MVIVERSNANQGGAFTPQSYEAILDAIRTPKSQWTKRLELAAGMISEFLINLARQILRRFGMPTDCEICREAVQEWWCLILRDRLSSYKPDCGFAKYARVFMMRAVGRIANRRRRTRPLDEADNIRSNTPSPLDQLAQLQTPGEIRVEIDRLRATLQEPLKCVFYDGLSIKQTGAKLGLTPNAVAGRLFRARGILRRRLERFRE
jgi:RNA polymerase sigma factor (sigma-70 family)